MGRVSLSRTSAAHHACSSAICREEKASAGPSGGPEQLHARRCVDRHPRPPPPALKRVLARVLPRVLSREEAVAAKEEAVAGGASIGRLTFTRARMEEEEAAAEEEAVEEEEEEEDGER